MLPTSCLCTQLRRASRGVTRRYDDALAAVGLGAAQFSLLRHVQRLGQPSISALAEAMGLDRSTLGRNLRVLEEQALLQLSEARDLRAREVSLTDAGERRIAQALPLWEQVQQELNLQLGEGRRAELMQLLEALA
ncbi:MULTISPECIES: MarR family winged helix-turn-helix transcriptional regulator [Pseudomonas]|jgi:DNA-binding MarR family transcriptional regulator|uniref:Transcriptional regulator, MarR family n=2 Tax=Ectopseudomonas TaxID=3236654 RepID=A0A653B9X6_ECTOL|nr:MULTISPECIES: MarR family winged helix-turn-helix transcriptional regulator [Pseudomonas]CAE6913737.1 Transcriptional regulator, MarR family [Pseudomonas oleovorans]QFT21726.1 transcriptional regulator SlyA [Pseudomonas sp. THAF187a]QFT41913.1 transcriptional regulator SlyA [Pseudomonas sp. THAF42]QTS88376.1 winged helix-turn-helix transcriptional regulator [Pseudomonas khazarica]WFC62092.1 MarR family transcriptional regulator [Pseudomonas sp. REST10]